MKSTLCFLIFTVTLVMKTWAIPVVEWSVVDVGTDTWIPFYGSGSYVTFSTDVYNGNGVCVWSSIQQDGTVAQLNAVTSLTGLKSSWFPISYGMLVDQNAATHGDVFYDQIGGMPGNPVELTFNVPLYLGFCLGMDYESAWYGWVELQYDGAGILALSSAVERTGLGIYAGTGTAIPEPATAGLWLLGAAGLVWRKRGRAEISSSR